MFLSKSFGYALRGVLYIASMQEEKRKIQVGEIAEQLSVPKHFLGKILQEIVKAGLLHSTKGPYGGFFLTKKTLAAPLISLVEITDDMKQFDTCALQLRNCDDNNPCPLHLEINLIKKRLMTVLNETTIADLLKDDKKIFINSIAAT